MRYSGAREVEVEMRIFLAGIIQGSKVAAEVHPQDWRDAVKAVITRHLPKADLYCHFSEHPDSIAYELPEIRETFTEGNRRAAACDVLVAYLPAASMGTAIEMHEAARSGAVVLTISPMAANWVIRAYSDAIFSDLSAFEAFLAGGGVEALLRRKARA